VPWPFKFSSTPSWLIDFGSSTAACVDNDKELTLNISSIEMIFSHLFFIIIFPRERKSITEVDVK
jgi:hypothetical protein